MFPATAFTPRYFPPRYFAEQGAAPPASISTNITIAGSVGTALAITGSNLMATISNISCYRGEALTLIDTLDPVPDGGIAGWSLTFSLKRNYGDAVALVTKTIGSGVTITDSANAVFTVALTT